MTAHMQTQWDRMTARQRITAVNVDIMNHKQFSTLSGAVMMGSVEVNAPIPTAGTNGKDIFYSEAFALAQTRKQLRYVHVHEALHIGLRHCVHVVVVLTNRKSHDLFNHIPCPPRIWRPNRATRK